MNEQEAKEILTRKLHEYRRKPYSELIRMIGGSPETSKSQGGSGALYSVEIQALWDNKPNGNIRVIGSIDDGGVRAFVRLMKTLLKVLMTNL
jgi:hypothetical protein